MQKVTKVCQVSVSRASSLNPLLLKASAQGYLPKAGLQSLIRFLLLVRRLCKLCKGYRKWVEFLLVVLGSSLDPLGLKG